MKKFLLLLICLLIPAVVFANASGGKHGKNITVTLTTVNSEVAQNIPPNTTVLKIQSRTAADFKMAFTSNESNSNFFTVKSGTVFTAENLDLQPLSYVSQNTTIYFQSANAGQVVEIVTF